MNDSAKSYLAEFIGTFALIFVGAGSICADAFLRSAGQGGVGLLGIALAHGLVVAVMVSATGHISGGHINPAVTIGVLLGGKIKTGTALGYIIAQLLGAALAALLLRSFFPADAWQSAHLGATEVAAGITPGVAAAIEMVLTFFLVFTVFGTAVDERGRGQIAGLGIGFVVAFDILAGGPLTGASMNPARTFGPALAGGYWSNHWVYWLGPLLGGAIAGLVYSGALLKEAPARAEAARR